MAATPRATPQNPTGRSIGTRAAPRSAFLCSLALVLLSTATAFSPFSYGAGGGDAGVARGLEWFTAGKLGMFVHNGPCTQWGTEISFPLMCTQFPCAPKGPGNKAVNITGPAELKAHRQAYADLAKTYDPSSWNATAMVLKAKAAGFKYIVYTTVHCDGFVNWNSTVEPSYNIMKTPFGRDIYGELVAAARQNGLKVGAYVCPSLWNSDLYWAPSALSTPGPCCAPNYKPADEPAKWNSYLAKLHGLIAELADNYRPDLFWIDCSNHPPNTDTRIEALLATIRAKNPEALVMTRGGVFSDYVDLGDQSEKLVGAILGQGAMSAGTAFEAGTVLQTSRQWAFDPASSQKPANLVIANLVLIASKGGNYLVNVAPGPDGLWASSAVSVLDELAAWFQVNGEALFGTEPMYPFQDSGVYFTTKAHGQDADHDAAAGEEGYVYAIMPSTNPGSSTTTTSTTTTTISTKRVHSDLVVPVPTGNTPEEPLVPAAGTHHDAPPLPSAAFTMATTPPAGAATVQFTIAAIRPAILKRGFLISKVSLLGSDAAVSASLSAAGLKVSYTPPATTLNTVQQNGVVFKIVFSSAAARAEL